jgi:hypothetical protein
MRFSSGVTMEKETALRDPFMNTIKEILVGGPKYEGKGSFRNLVYSEVQNYSREVQETEHTSDFFFKLTELIVDCQSLTMPDDSFKIVVAHLLYECSNSKAPLDEDLQKLTGMDAASLEAARDFFKDKECIESMLAGGKASANGKKKKGSPFALDE